MASAEAHRALVERLEREAQHAPARYKAKLALLASLGFLVLGGAVLLAFGLSVGLVLVLAAISPVLLAKLIKVVWIPIALGWMILRALWVKFPPPEGYRLREGEAPALRAEIERLRAATAAPRLDGIVIDGDLNASAASVPRLLGLFGHRHYLVLGLPLMQLLDRDQFASVVAHEFGHFGGGHGRFAGWIYRVRASWYRLLDALSEQRSWASGMFVKFFDWYAPYFNAYSFVLARANEYQADAAAARAVGARAAGHALIRVNLGAARLSQDFWPGMQAASRAQPAPPALLFRDMADSLRSPGQDDAERLAQSLARASDFGDTHPTLAQRLATLGVEAELVPPPSRSAAEALLGELLPVLECRFSDEWRAHNAPAWEGNFQQHAQDQRRLAELDRQAERDVDETVEHLRLRESLRPDEDLLPHWRALVERAPAHALVRFRIGVLSLAQGDASGVDALWEAIRLEPDSSQVVLPHLYEHYERVGDADGMARAEAAWRQLQQAQAQIERARNVLSGSDVFLPHGLDEATLRGVRALLEREGGVSRAWLVRKRLPGGPGEQPHFVLLLKWRGILLSENGKLQRIVDGLRLPGSVMVFVPQDRRAIARKLRKVAGVPLHRKGWW